MSIEVVCKLRNFCMKISNPSKTPGPITGSDHGGFGTGQTPVFYWTVTLLIVREDKLISSSRKLYVFWNCPGLPYLIQPVEILNALSC